MAAPGPNDADAPADVDLTALEALAMELAIAAGAVLMAGLGRTRTSVSTKSTATDLVTEIDRASERRIVDGLLAARPHDGIIGEEGTDREGSSGIRWVIDPLDGTTNYVYAHPGFAVSIAAEAHDPAAGPTGTPLVGVVFDPLHDDCFTARRGAGAWRNGQPITCSAETDLAQALVATGFGYAAARRARQAEVLAAVLPRVRDIRRMGAAALDLCSVACGRVDAFYERGLAHWDHAAGALIATEAGAVVGNVRGGPPDSGSVVAGPAALVEPLRALLAQQRADED